MTYIDAINQMWEANEIHSFTHAELVVYMALIDTWNRCGRKMEIGIDYESMTDKSRTSKDTYYRALRKLSESGLIAYKKGHKSNTLGKVQILKFRNEMRIKRESNANETRNESESNANETRMNCEHYNEELMSNRVKSKEKESKESFFNSSSMSQATNDDDTEKIGGNDLVLTDLGRHGAPKTSPHVAARPPSLGEVADYLESQGLYRSQAEFEAPKFINYNQKLGWLTPKGKKIRDWRPIADNWMMKINDYERRDTDQQQGAVNSRAKRHPDFASDERLNDLYG